ncbi:hypothetical protein Tco_0892827 [Tanacetum coccineum]|uniref:Uncharacterized protein n=1 Tax=Tanacetum coccineum TaxID=301880 RepID=A0ABQ5C721_9ASTR
MHDTSPNLHQGLQRTPSHRALLGILSYYCQYYFTTADLDLFGTALKAYTLNSSVSDIEANLEIIAYQLGLESVEVQLVVHQKNEVVYEEKISVLEFEVKDKVKISNTPPSNTSVEMLRSVRPSGVIIEDWAVLLKIYKSNFFKALLLHGTISSLNSQNAAILSAEDTSNSNEVNISNGVSIASGHNSQGQASSSSYIDDLMWPMLSMRVKRFYKKTRRKLIFNGKEPSTKKSKEQEWRCRDNTKRTVPVETSDALVVQDNALIVQDGLGCDWSYIAQDEPTEFALMDLPTLANSQGYNTEEFEVKDKSNAITRLKNLLDETLREKDDLKAKLEQFETSSKNLNKLINSQLSAKDKTGLGYGDQLNENDSSGSELFNSVFDSRSSDGDDNQTNDRPTANKTSASVSQVEASTSQTSNTSVEMPRVESVRPSGVIIEDWVSDDEDIFQSNDLQATDKPSLKKDIKVLVTKPHNKTPYELIIGRPPSISFMRPFGRPITNLNTLDPLGKFDGKAEEGFLVGYSVNSKAFRRTRILNWIFDIDSLTISMKYQPVTVGNQTNKNAGPQEANGNTYLKQSVDAGQSKEKNSSDEKYKNDTADDAAGVTPIQKPASENEQALKNVLDKIMDQEKEATKQSDVVRKEFEAQCNKELLQGKATRASSTNSFNTVRTPVNAASAPRTFNDARPSFVPLGGSFPLDVNDPPDDPLMPDLEDTAEVQHTGIFGSAYDDDDDLDTCNSPYIDQGVGAEADFSPITTTRVHFIHPKDQMIRDPRSAVQTRGMTKKSSGEHAMISYVQKQRRSNHKDFQNYLVACFLSQQEPTKIAQAFDDESWFEAMQEELL